MTKNATEQLPIDAFAEPLVKYLTKKVGNSEDAFDLAQEALLRAHSFQKRQSLDNTQAFLFKTANNLLIDQVRRSKVHDKFLSMEIQSARDEETAKSLSPSAERTVSAEQDLANINRAMNTLPHKVQQAFIMSRGKDMSYPQIAREMNVSTSMVEKYIVQALKALRSELA